MKNHISNILLILVLFVGLSLLLYPTVSDYWNALHQSRAIANYAEAVAVIEENQYAQLWEKARTYNRELALNGNTWSMTEEQREEYYG